MKTAQKNIKLLMEVKKCLCYYANFKHPLTLEEIHFNLQVKCSKNEVKIILDQLVDTNEIYQFQKFHSISKYDISHWIDRRQKGEKEAKRIYDSAKIFGKFIYFFPFVRFVGISGSLSKGYFSRDSDFDFFIISSKNRLWICRSILHLFKKLSFLFGLEHKFCMNYFIDESHKEIEEQNYYTSIEISSLNPIAGKEQYDQLLSKNSWRKKFLPNTYQAFFQSDSILNKKYLLKQLIEAMFKPFGEQLNIYLMKLTDRRWRKKWQRKNYPMEEYELAFKTTLHHSKNHPANYQKKLLQSIEQQ